MTVEGKDSRASPLQLKVSNWNRSVFLRSSSPLVPVRRSTSWQELWRIRQSHLSGSQRSVTRAQSPHYTLKCISMTRSQNSGQNTQMLKQLCATPWVQEGNLPSDRSLTIKERSPLHDSTHNTEGTMTELQEQEVRSLQQWPGTPLCESTSQEAANTGLGSCH